MRPILAFTMLWWVGCAGPAPAPAQAVQPSSAEPHPYIAWDVTTDRGHDEGSSSTGAGEHLWSVAPEYGDTFGVTFSLDELIGLRFETARRLVPGTVDLTDEKQASLWTLDCPAWIGQARVVSDLPHWSLALHATCAMDPTRVVDATFEGWSE
jgi:hypothetical protein